MTKFWKFPLLKLLYRKYIKRVLDMLIALTALIIFMPFLFIIGILVRIKLGTPVFFKQNRPGLNERIFIIYKFRTMTNQTDKNGNLLSDGDRTTKFGRYLRNSSIDELPELWNIFKGDMSFVGPRPLLVQYLPHYNQKQRLRHSVRPGLTGLAQISGRNNISWDEKFEYDIEYVSKISFFGDFKIILKTVYMVICKQGIEGNNPNTGSIWKK